MHDIIIFGGGLSGLTLAHELSKKGFKILKNFYDLEK